MSENKPMNFGGHNYYADYKYKVKVRQKANGELQIEEIGVSSDEVGGLILTELTLVEDTYKFGREKGLNMLSPYIKGKEPNVLN